ncbi:hypothetical protein N9C16_06925 [Paracoccaceae bacterium]|nr:hypothetical protein [Paracoccaceae bacterium]
MGEKDKKVETGPKKWEILQSVFNRYYSSYLTFFAIIFLAIALYFGYDKLIGATTTATAREAINAAIGVIFVIITTMFMLGKQSDIEQKSELNSKVFEKKLALYEEALSIWRRIGLIDGKVTQEDFAECVGIELRLAMLAPSNVLDPSLVIFNVITDAYKSKKLSGLEEDGHEELVTNLGQFAIATRKDLDLPKTDLMGDLEGKLKDAVQKMRREKNHDRYVFNGQYYTKGRLVLALVKFVAKDKKVESFEKLKCMFPADWHGAKKSTDSSFVVQSEKLVNDLQNEGKKNIKVYKKPEDLIELGNGTKALVQSNWGDNKGIGNIENFVFKVTNASWLDGYHIKREPYDPKNN